MSDANDQRPVDEPPPLAPGERRVAARDLPQMPERSSVPQASQGRRPGGLAAIFVAMIGIVVICAILFLCSGGNLGAVMIAVGMFLFALLHYLLWGWWLGGAIRRQVEQEDRAEP
jgi:hypothetical protein